MSDEDTKVTPDLDEGGDKTPTGDNTPTINEEGDKTNLDPQTLLHQKQAYKDKFEKEHTEFEKYKIDNPPKKIEIKKDINVKDNPDLAGVKKEIQAIKFAQAHPEIQGEDIQEILDVADRKSIDAEKALEIPMIKTYLESKGDARAVANAMPSNSRSPKVQPSKPISEMTEEEHRKFFDKVISSKT